MQVGGLAPPDREEWASLYTAFAILRKETDRALLPWRLTVPQASVLALLAEAGSPLPVTRLARLLLQESPSVTSLVDRMCAGGMTAINCGVSAIAMGMADAIVAGGVEHMGHHPMAQGAEPNARIISEKLVDPSALNMGMTAENIHDRYPELTREMADEYAVYCQQKAKKALDEGYFDDIIVPMTVWTTEGWKIADHDEQPRPDATVESMQGLRLPFRKGGRVTAGNSSGLNDGAAGAILVSGKLVKELGLKPKMKAVGFAYAGVEPEVMGLGPIPATERVLKRTGLKFDDLDYIELN